MVRTVRVLDENKQYRCNYCFKFTTYAQEIPLYEKVDGVRVCPHSGEVFTMGMLLTTAVISKKSIRICFCCFSMLILENELPVVDEVRASKNDLPFWCSCCDILQVECKTANGFEHGRKICGYCRRMKLDFKKVVRQILTAWELPQEFIINALARQILIPHESKRHRSVCKLCIESPITREFAEVGPGTGVVYAEKTIYCIPHFTNLFPHIAIPTTKTTLPNRQILSEPVRMFMPPPAGSPPKKADNCETGLQRLECVTDIDCLAEVALDLGPILTTTIDFPQPCVNPIYETANGTVIDQNAMSDCLNELLFSWNHFNQCFN